MKLVHLERRSVDNEIIVSQSVITALFRRFAGPQPTTPQTAQALDPTAAYHERAKGIQLTDMTDPQPSPTGKSHFITHRHCFASLAALEWHYEFSSVVGRKEAAEIATQFVRFGLITLVSDKREINDSAIIFTVRGSAPGGNSPVSQAGEYEFRCTTKSIYKITDEGMRTARWDVRTVGSKDSSTISMANLSTTERSSTERSSFDRDGGTPKGISSRL